MKLVSSSNQSSDHPPLSSPLSPPESPRQTRLTQKVASTTLGSPRNKTVNWTSQRVFSPGKAFGYKTPLGVEYVDGGVLLFLSGQNSQGLILEEGHVAGASVTTTIKTETARKNEKKGTYIQYDKERVKQVDTDFQVVATNRSGAVNYQGGHLIDHKYSAEGSHRNESNYFPQHFMINSPFKEYLVQRSQEFVEIPLYTSNPPTIGVKGSKDHDHPIPVGEIFIQINEGEISAVYYFPNNNFDYEGLKTTLKIKKDIAKTMIPYFKLKPCFYPLFQPAIVTEFGSAEERKSEQSRNEDQFIELMEMVTEGMGLAESDEEEEEIVQLAYSVVHKEGHVDPSLFLECCDLPWDQINGELLHAPFSALGKFLVTYLIRNALKAEVLSIHSRLLFLSGLTDFIEGYDAVNDEAHEFVNTLAEEFESTFAELQRIKHIMNQEELFFFADIYQRISDHTNHFFTNLVYEIYFRETLEFFMDYIKMLKYIASRYKIEELKDDYVARFFDFMQSAQDSLDYWINAGVPREVFLDTNTFLQSMREPCLTLFAKNQNASATFQTNIHWEKSTRSSLDYVSSILATLGLSDETLSDQVEEDTNSSSNEG